MSQIGRLTRRSRASASSTGHSMIDGLYGLCVSSSIRQKAALCASLPGAIGPDSLAAQTRAAQSAALTAASSNIRTTSFAGAPGAARPFADRSSRAHGERFGGPVTSLLPRPAVDAPDWRHYIAASARERCPNRNCSREAYLSAQQPRSQTPSWVSGEDGDGGRPPSSGSAPREGPQAPVRLTPGFGGRHKTCGPEARNAKDSRRLSSAGERRAVVREAELGCASRTASRRSPWRRGDTGRVHREPKSRQCRRPQPRKATDAGGRGERAAVPWTTGNRLCADCQGGNG